MKKIFTFAAVLMMLAFVTAINAEARSGGLPDIVVDNAIKDCSCPPCCTEAAPAKEKATVRLKVMFDTDKAVVKERYHKDIQSIAVFLKLNPDLKITIEGHTDNVGNDEYNQKLSENRANAIRQYLIDKFGIEGSRLTAVGYGESKPIASNDTETGRQINRRVQAVFDVTMVVTDAIVTVNPDKK
jgi:outer membrane protein OmpA-like peptidoglycan-associated protein